jgi:hypothetical protein
MSSTLTSKEMRPAAEAVDRRGVRFGRRWWLSVLLVYVCRAATVPALAVAVRLGVGVAKTGLGGD